MSCFCYFIPQNGPLILLFVICHPGQSIQSLYSSIKSSSSVSRRQRRARSPHCDLASRPRHKRLRPAFTAPPSTLSATSSAVSTYQHPPSSSSSSPLQKSSSSNPAAAESNGFLPYPDPGNPGLVLPAPVTPEKPVHRKPHTIWRLVDEGMENGSGGDSNGARSEAGGNSVDEPEKTALIFGRSDGETVFCPKFMSTTWKWPGSAEVPSMPYCPHVKKRHLLLSYVDANRGSNGTPSASSTSTLGSGTATIGVEAPTVIGQTPTAPDVAFRIHRDSDSTPVASLPVHRPEKIGIVISHGRSMTLQDKLQRMAAAAATEGRLNATGQQRDEEYSTGYPEFRKVAVGRRSGSHDRRRRKSKTAVKRPASALGLPVSILMSFIV